MSRSIRFREPYASNFEEVVRAIAEKHNGDVPYPNTFAIRNFIDLYVDNHPDEFVEKDRQIVYLGGDSVKGVPEDDPEPATLQDGNNDGSGDNNKITFSLSEGYNGE